jgi:hypothetical protein
MFRRDDRSKPVEPFRSVDRDVIYKSRTASETSLQRNSRQPLRIINPFRYL